MPAVDRHFIWGPRRDLAVFALPTALGILVWLAAPRGRALPEWAFLALVIGVDVAHVWSTLFRTYLDGEELRRRRVTYTLVPLSCLLLGVGLNAFSGALFWRVLAYFAVLHFVRQQLGWAAIYRAHAGQRTRLDRWLDDATLCLATGVPLLHWHTHLPRPFWWFVEGDFVRLPWLSFLVAPAEALLALALLAFAVRQLVLWRRGNLPSIGKIILVLSTAVSWWMGIVAAESDLAFTALNVLPHGVPYFLLLFTYAQARAEERPRLLGARVVRLGAGAFVLSLVVLAFFEEALWDRLVFHDHARLFGFFPDFDTTPFAHFLVPLLALPQATHYALDALLWRRKDTGPAQARALGFGQAPAVR